MEMGRCKDCEYWRTFPTRCPMVFEQWFYDDQWGESDFTTHDNRRYDGMGYCDAFRKCEQEEQHDSK